MGRSVSIRLHCIIFIRCPLDPIEHDHDSRNHKKPSLHLDNCLTFPLKMVSTDSKVSDVKIRDIELEDNEKLNPIPLDAHYDPAFVKKTMCACSSSQFQGF